MIRWIFIVIMVVMGVQVAQAEAFNQEFDDQVIAALKEVPWSNKEEMTSYGELMLNKGEEEGSCFDVVIGSYLLAEVASRAGEWDEALALLARHESCLKQSTSVQYQQANLHFFKGAYADARAHWRFVAAHGAQDNPANATQNIGSCFQREGQLDSAQFYYEEALRMQGDEVKLMTLNNIVSMLNARARYRDVRPFFEVARRIEVTDSVALDMLYWNMLSATVMMDDRDEALNIFRERRSIGLDGVPDYAVEVYWTYLLLMDDYDTFIAHRANLSPQLLKVLFDQSPDFLEDLFDDDSGSDIGRLPLSVKWDIARRGLKLEQRYTRVSAPTGSVVILQDKLERMLAERRRLNWLLLGTGAFMLFAAGMYYLRKWQQRRGREDAASRLQFDASDHKSIQFIRDALISQSNSEDAIAHLAELKELLEAKQSESMHRWLAQSNLTDSELRLLELIGKGYTASECSKLMNCTKSHVYNLRSHIRKKLNLEESESLKSWVMREMAR